MCLQALSALPLSAVSSVPNSLYDGPIEVDPVNYTDCEIDDEDIFAMAGAALQAAMGGSMNITAETSKLNTSMTAMTNPSLYSTSTQIQSLWQFLIRGDLVKDPRPPQPSPG